MAFRVVLKIREWVPGKAEGMSLCDRFGLHRVRKEAQCLHA